LRLYFSRIGGSAAKLDDPTCRQLYDEDEKKSTAKEPVYDSFFVRFQEGGG
jgi:hypothetical protein